MTSKKTKLRIMRLLTNILAHGSNLAPNRVECVGAAEGVLLLPVRLARAEVLRELQAV